MVFLQIEKYLVLKNNSRKLTSLLNLRGRGVERKIILGCGKAMWRSHLLQQKRGIINLPFGLYVIKNWESGFRTALLVGVREIEKVTPS